MTFEDSLCGDYSTRRILGGSGVLIQRSSVTPPRPLTEVEVGIAPLVAGEPRRLSGAGFIAYLRTATIEEAPIVAANWLAAVAAVESHTGRLWLPAVNDGDRTAVAELNASAAETVPLMPEFPNTPGAVLTGVDRWTDGAWSALELADLERPDPWRWRAPAAGSYRTTATYTAALSLPGLVQSALDLLQSYLYEYRGDADSGGPTLGSTAGGLLRSGAADLLRDWHRIAL